MVASGYKLRKHQTCGVKQHWRCSTHFQKGCRAVIHTSKDVSYSISQKGRAIIVASGYRFRKHQAFGIKHYWKCSTHFSRGCRATIHTLMDDNSVLKCFNVHNH